MTNFKARPTTYKGIQMRSRLEAAFAAWLDKFGITWNYEPRAYAGENGQYLPDFELPEISFAGLPAQVVFVEIKPRQPDLELLLMQRAILLESEPEAHLIVVWPDGHRYRTMLAYEGYGQTVIWATRAEGLSLEVEIAPYLGPWYGEYWKPKPS